MIPLSLGLITASSPEKFSRQTAALHEHRTRPGDILLISGVGSDQGQYLIRGDTLIQARLKQTEKTEPSEPGNADAEGVSVIRRLLEHCEEQARDEQSWIKPNVITVFRATQELMMAAEERNVEPQLTTELIAAVCMKLWRDEKNVRSHFTFNGWKRDNNYVKLNWPVNSELPRLDARHIVETIYGQHLLALQHQLMAQSMQKMENMLLSLTRQPRMTTPPAQAPAPENQSCGT